MSCVTSSPIRHPTAPYQWSVDFVEHLRTVHFLMVSLSAALIIIVAGSRDRHVANALSQATEIADFSDRWQDVRSALFAQAVRQSGLKIDDREIDTVFVLKSARFSMQRTGVQFSIPPTEYTKYEAWKIKGPDMSAGPRTLAEFRNWWQALRAGLTIRIPDLESASTRDRYRCDAEIKDPNDAVHVMARTNCELVGMMAFISERVILKGELHFHHLGNDDTVFLYGELPVKGVSTKGTLEEQILEIYVGDQWPLKSVLLKEDSMKAIFGDWKTGDFESAFPELAAVSSDLNNIPLKSLPSRLADLQPKGTENIEAVGIKLPSEQVTRWGLVVLLAAQFYFWLHLHEFSLKVDGTSPGLDVAWIGVYRSRAALCVNVVSACAIPVVAISVLAQHLPADLPPIWGEGAVRVIIAIVLLATAVLAAFTADQLFKVRSFISSAQTLLVQPAGGPQEQKSADAI